MMDEDLSLDDWFEFVCSSYTTPGLSYKGRALPAFPDEQTQTNTVGATGRACLEEANAFYQVCESRFNGSALWQKEDKHLLDFGCGWGRIARFFYRDFLPRNVVGVDVQEELLTICRQTFTGPTFLRSTPVPPTGLESGSVDFIVSYSVFSHLGERACNEWIRDFSRLLAPGGMAAITTRGRSFFETCRSFKNKGHTGYLEALSRLFPDFDRAILDYESGCFVHSNIHEVTGGGALTAEFYGETFIPEKYAREVLSRHLEFVEYCFEPSRNIQPTLFFRKAGSRTEG
jgi:SAM-dependent methyltransferase